MYSGESMMHVVKQDNDKRRKAAVSKPLAPLLKEQSLLDNYYTQLSKPVVTDKYKQALKEQIEKDFKASFVGVAISDEELNKKVSEFLEKQKQKGLFL